MKIEHSFDRRPTADQIIELNDNAGLPRPNHDKKRIQKRFDNLNLITLDKNKITTLMGCTKP